MKLNIIEWRDVYGEEHREAIIGPRGQAQAAIRERPGFANTITIKVITIDNCEIID